MAAACFSGGPHTSSGAMRDQVLTLADGSRVRLGDLPADELRVLARLLRRAAELAGSEDER